MGKARTSRATYERLLNAFRERPGVYGYAARSAGVTHKLAKKAWNDGWDSPDWARPIQVVLLEEKGAIRAQLNPKQQEEEHQRLTNLERRKEREAARIDAAREKAREVEGVRASLNGALTTLACAGQLSGPALELSKYAQVLVLEQLRAEKLTLEEALEFLRQISLLTMRAVSTMKNAMEILRLHIGEPGAILGVQVTDANTTEVNAEAAANALGEEALQVVALSLAEGKITPEVERFIAWQAEQTAGAAVH